MPKIINEYTLEKYNESIRLKIKKNIRKNRTGCWVWQKPSGKNPYGCISYRSKTINVHRLSWIVFKGEIPYNIYVCHKCDNKKCCNPDHLFLGTAKENTRDMMSKKKVFDFVGEKNNYAILTEKKVLEIRRLREEGYTITQIAELLKIKRGTCNQVVYRINWKHI